MKVLSIFLGLKMKAGIIDQLIAETEKLKNFIKREMHHSNCLFLILEVYESCEGHQNSVR
jgi:hypothetical protein